MKQRLSIYLAKNGIIQDDHLLDLERMREAKYLNIPDTESVIYIHQPKPARFPDWVGYIISSQSEIGYDDFSKCQSESAVIIVRFSGVIFLITFGGGHHKVKKENIERDFGLRVTLNSVDPDKLKSLDKSNYQDSPLNTRSQSTKEVDISSLNIDSELDILSTLTGKSNVDIFGDIVTGKDSLIITPPVSIDSLQSVLSEALNRFKQKLPKEFEWIDNISKVKDRDLSDVLDLELNEYLKDDDRSEEFWIGEPELVDWTAQIGYVFGRITSRSEIHPTLVFDNLKKYISLNKLDLSCDVLKSLKIHIIKENEISYDSWSAFNCLYAEVKNKNETYILRNGSWYAVNASFIASLDKSLESVLPYDFELPIYNHLREDEYNKYVENNCDACINMDKKLLHHGGRNNKFEFADILRNGTDFIHVKYYRSSSTLSHLFAQAYVSLELFVSDAAFRAKLNKVLPNDSKLIDVSSRPDTQNYVVVYAIAINRDIPKNLPLFSKITLKNTVKSLRNLGFTIKLAQIKVDPELAKRKILRSKK
ncbi:TIGR04141 family sporadically distributed protein [Serratia marcescens]|uniref:TIGR04141 family sporadically distributed protein n=3 Tax=Serratia TaxID=613 RepID=UPI003989D8C9